MKGIIPRVVLDTNVLISALIFRRPTSALVSLWQQGMIRPLISKNVLIEYLRALSYPKFGLSKTDVRAILEEAFLPHADGVIVHTKLQVIAEGQDDDKFLELAVDGRADVILSGDAHLLALGEYRGIPIVRAGVFLKKF